MLRRLLFFILPMISASPPPIVAGFQLNAAGTPATWDIGNGTLLDARLQ